VSGCCSQKPSGLYGRIKVASELENASGGLGLVTQVVVAGKTGEPGRQTFDFWRDRVSTAKHARHALGQLRQSCAWMFGCTSVNQLQPPSRTGSLLYCKQLDCSVSPCVAATFCPDLGSFARGAPRPQQRSQYQVWHTAVFSFTPFALAVNGYPMALHEHC
jgi:hypothetical protein